MQERDIYSSNSSYTLKSTQNNYCQRYNTTLYFFSSIFFIFSSDGMKKETGFLFSWKEKMEEDCRLNINMEDHIADLYCLFRYFKNMWPFLLTLVSLCKNIFLLVVGRKNRLSFHRRDIDFADGIVLLAL